MEVLRISYLHGYKILHPIAKTGAYNLASEAASEHFKGPQ